MAGAPKGKMIEPEKFMALLQCLSPTVLKANQPPAHQYLGSGKEGKAPNFKPVCSHMRVEGVEAGELIQDTRDTRG